jgi:signal transduction histidine kinase
VASIRIGGADSVADSTLTRVGRARADTGRIGVDVVGRQTVITLRDRATVYGAVVPVGALATTLFGAAAPMAVMHGPAAEMHARHMAEHRRLVQLDTLGLGIAADSISVFGAVADRPYTATATLPPPLERFHVNVSMMSSQVSLPLMMPSYNRLWLNGHLLLATIVVCIFAVGASRREVALARARSDFVAGISHDLRMPLAQILLASETLSLGRDRNEGERATLTASILREGRRLKAMIDNVLIFSRSGAVGLQPNLQVLDARSVLDAVAQSVSLAVADAGQSITVGADASRVVADRALVHQALVNLLDNAMKYGPCGQTIRLMAARLDKSVELAIEDEGPGIPRAARSRLFEPYERLPHDSSSERTGSGLGLAVARQIVVACKGTIRIDDGARGARIVVSLPAAP